MFMLVSGAYQLTMYMLDKTSKNDSGWTFQGYKSFVKFYLLKTTSLFK